MRPEILFPLFAAASTLKGVGPRRAELLRKLGIERVRDVLLLAPTGIIDRRLRPSVQGAAAGSVVTVRVTVGAHRPAARKSAPYRVTVTDSLTDFLVVFFHAHEDFVRRQLPPGAARTISGRIEIYDGIAQMAHPDHILPEDETPPPFEPVYPLTAGLPAKAMTGVVQAALSHLPALPEWLDPALVAKRAWPSWQEAVRALHAPDTADALAPARPARERLAYDEILSHQLALGLARARMQRKAGRETIGGGALRRAALSALPFTPTAAQSRCLSEIEADMAAPVRMLRLLQGDVGAGKTLVAFLSMLIAVEAGGQAALMAPTEILARQHARSLSPLADAAGIRLVALTGRDKGAARTALLERIARGDADIVIGTHALFQGSVAFADLRLAAVDEQHRFGVEQRMELAAKGRGVDILSMTATPIPRTLALTHYGDMDFSLLDEKPPGRTPVETRLVSLSRYQEVIEGLRRALAAGRRAYWVCPLVEDSDAMDVTAAESRALSLRAIFGDGAVALAHGRLPPGEKDAAMTRFRDGAAQILVATTVIEVGVDVPEATIMVIEHAERFGLSQLHQLRGRVGRGADRSTCLLLYQGPLGETARARLAILRETEDGFRIAEEDLRLRGSGDLLGIRQAGVPDWRFADADAHGGLMAIARDDARLVLSRDEGLVSLRGAALRTLLYLFDRDAAVRYLQSA